MYVVGRAGYNGESFALLSELHEKQPKTQGACKRLSVCMCMRVCDEHRRLKCIIKIKMAIAGRGW